MVTLGTAKSSSCSRPETKTELAKIRLKSDFPSSHCYLYVNRFRVYGILRLLHHHRNGQLQGLAKVPGISKLASGVGI